MWNLTTNCLREPEDFADITADYAAEAASHGARYVEAIFSPAERMLRGVAPEALFEGYTEGVRRAWDDHGVVLRLTPDLFWGVDPTLAEETARWAVRHREDGVVGLGIGGGEDMGDPMAVRRAFQVAREGGLAAVPHAGETSGPERVRRVMEALHPRRIRHGIGAIADPGLVGEIAARGIGLDVCPTSNLRTRVVSDVADVPLAALHRAGVRVTVATDDPAMFGTDLATEHTIAHAAGLDDAQLWANAMATCAADPATLRRLRQLGGTPDAGTDGDGW